LNLTNYSFYNLLDSVSKEFLDKHLNHVKVTKDSILFFQGDICDSILFLTSGKVKLYIQSDNGDEITLYNLSSGEQCIVNTASTISQTNAIGSAVAVTDIEGYLLNASDVKKLAHMSDAYQSFLFSVYTLRMNDLVQLVSDIKFKKLDERVIQWLENQNEKLINTTHDGLANELGSTRVVISRVLKELEKGGKLKLTRGAIELTNYTR